MNKSDVKRRNTLGCLDQYRHQIVNTQQAFTNAPSSVDCPESDCRILPQFRLPRIAPIQNCSIPIAPILITPNWPIPLGLNYPDSDGPDLVCPAPIPIVRNNSNSDCPWIAPSKQVSCESRRNFLPNRQKIWGILFDLQKSWWTTTDDGRRTNGSISDKLHLTMPAAGLI